MKPIRVYLRETARVALADLDEGLAAMIRERLTFRNPLFGRPPRFGRDPADAPPVLKAFHEEGGEFSVARGWFEELVRLLHAHGYKPELVNDTPRFDMAPEFDSRLHKEMWGLDFPAQHDALTELCRHKFAILEGPPFSGKRMLAVKLAHRRRVPVLVIVTDKRSMYLWKEELVKWAIPAGCIGVLGDGKKELGRLVTVASSITLWRTLSSGEMPAETGYLIVDRCNDSHFGLIFRLRRINATYVLGLATGPRGDGLTKLMHAHIGPPVFRLADVNSPVNPPSVEVRPTGCAPHEASDWAGYVSNLAGIAARNAQIVGDLLKATAERGKSVVVSERVGHLKDMAGQVERGLGPEMALIHADTSEEERKRLLDRWARGYLKILGVTLRTVPALADMKGIRNLFITTPMRPDDHLCLLLYRMSEDGPRGATIYEYMDDDPVLKGSLARRMKVYRRMGIRK